MVETPHLHHIEVPGGVVGFTVRGQGPTVVLLPGCGRPASDLDPLADAIAAAARRCWSCRARSIGPRRRPTARP